MHSVIKSLRYVICGFYYTQCFKKRGVELFELHQLLTDFENSFTVGNSNKLSAK